MLVEDVKWYIQTCHASQTCQTMKLHIPPTVLLISRLFHKVHINAMLMPKAGGYRYIVQARCTLTSYPEWRMSHSDKVVGLASFIFEDILCRWGPMSEIVTDNGPSFIQALEFLTERHGIQHIWISPYNLQANGNIECWHFDIWEAIMKSCDGKEVCWPHTAHLVFWAERVTIQRSTGLSPYFMAHGIELLFPFDLTEATFLVLIPDTDQISTSALLAFHTHQLQKCVEDLESIKEHILKTHFTSVKKFEAVFKNQIKDYNFQPGSLILVRNFRSEKELNRETKPRYMGSMVVLCQTTDGSYMLAELDGVVSNLQFTTFRLVPYHARTNFTIPQYFTEYDDDELDSIAEKADEELDNEESGQSGCVESD
jgi:hypothetical protein